jgi:hypothetical protein
MVRWERRLWNKADHLESWSERISNSINGKEKNDS